VRRLIATLMFLMFVNESGVGYIDKLPSLFGWVQGLLFDPLPIKLRLFDVLIIFAGVASARAKAPLVKPLRSAMFLAMGTTVVWFVVGVLRGGDSRVASWQVYLMLASPVAALSIATAFHKAAHFRLLGKAIVAAALFRAVMCVIYYFSYVRNSLEAVPATITIHDDTVLWVVAIIIVVVNFLENRTTQAKLAAYLGIPMMLLAIQFNNRRLAWVSLAGALIVLYFMVPASPLKSRLRRIARVITPVIALYVVVGWGRPERIFKPLSSISSVSSQPDPSTLARNVENLSLIFTASFSPKMGTGWGHRYIELSNKYTIADSFELWPFIPHNSILGLFAYTGFLGFIGYWMMLPTAVYFHARSCRTTKQSQARSVSLVGATMMVVCLNQLFGDMGIFSPQVMYMLSICLGAALRVPVEAEAWTAPRRSAVPAPAPMPEPLAAPAPPPAPTLPPAQPGAPIAGA